MVLIKNDDLTILWPGLMLTLCNAPILRITPTGRKELQNESHDPSHYRTGFHRAVHSTGASDVFRRNAVPGRPQGAGESVAGSERTGLDYKARQLVPPSGGQESRSLPGPVHRCFRPRAQDSLSRAARLLLTPGAASATLQRSMATITPAAPHARMTGITPAL